MEHETFMLKGLFAACLLSCTLVMGSMLFGPSRAVQPAAGALATSTSACVASHGGTACPPPRARG